MTRFLGWVVVALLALAAWAWQARTVSPPDPAGPAPSLPTATQGLPREAWDTVSLIQRGGPFPHRQDGSVFGNRERLLPPRARGYYREYTVDTPGAGDRGARRIVAGGQPPAEFWYTDDHYRSFRRFNPAQGNAP